MNSTYIHKYDAEDYSQSWAPGTQCHRI